MTENNYIDFDEIEKNYEEKIREHNRKIQEREEKIAEKEHQEMSHLMNGLTNKIMNDATEKREKERKHAKAKAIKEIDAKYDKHGLVKSDDEKERDQAYKGLLDSLHVNEDKSGTPGTLNKMLVDRATYNKGIGIDDNKERTPLDKEYLDIIKDFESKDDSDTSLNQYLK